MAQAPRHTPVVATVPLGCNPRHVVVNPTGSHIYATTANSVNVIDSAHRVIASIPVDAEPKRTTVSADGSRIYVTGYNGSISIINTMDYTVRTVVGDAITAEVVSPEDNYIYLAHCQGHNCWVSAVSDVGATAAVVPVDSYATALTLSPDGRRLYVASSKPRSARQHGSGSVAVVDTATFALIDVVAMQFAPDTTVVSPDGSTLYATHYHRNAISVIELASHSHTLIGLDDAPLDVAQSPNGEQLYVTNLHSLALIDTATNVAESVPIGDLPRHFHVSGDGKRAYVTDLGHNSVWVMDPFDKTITAMVDLGRDPEALTLSVDEKHLYVADRLAPTLTVISLVPSEPSANEPAAHRS